MEVDMRSGASSPSSPLKRSNSLFRDSRSSSSGGLQRSQRSFTRKFQVYFAPPERPLSPHEQHHIVVPELSLEPHQHHALITPRNSVGSPLSQRSNSVDTGDSSASCSPLHRSMRQSSTPGQELCSPVSALRRAVPPIAPRAATNPRQYASGELSPSTFARSVVEPMPDIPELESPRRRDGGAVVVLLPTKESPLLSALARSQSTSRSSTSSRSGFFTNSGVVALADPDHPLTFLSESQTEVQFFWNTLCGSNDEDFVDSLCSGEDRVEDANSESSDDH